MARTLPTIERLKRTKAYQALGLDDRRKFIARARASSLASKFRDKFTPEQLWSYAEKTAEEEVSPRFFSEQLPASFKRGVGEATAATANLGENIAKFGDYVAGDAGEKMLNNPLLKRFAGGGIDYLETPQGEDEERESPKDRREVLSAVDAIEDGGVDRLNHYGRMRKWGQELSTENTLRGRTPVGTVVDTVAAGVGSMLPFIPAAGIARVPMGILKAKKTIGLAKKLGMGRKLRTRGEHALREMGTLAGAEALLSEEGYRGEGAAHGAMLGLPIAGIQRLRGWKKPTLAGAALFGGLGAHHGGTPAEVLGEALTGGFFFGMSPFQRARKRRAIQEDHMRRLEEADIRAASEKLRWEQDKAVEQKTLDLGLETPQYAVQDIPQVPMVTGRGARTSPGVHQPELPFETPGGHLPRDVSIEPKYTTLHPKSDRDLYLEALKRKGEVTASQTRVTERIRPVREAMTRVEELRHENVKMLHEAEARIHELETLAVRTKGTPQHREVVGLLEQMRAQVKSLTESVYGKGEAAGQMTMFGRDPVQPQPKVSPGPSVVDRVRPKGDQGVSQPELPLGTAQTGVPLESGVTRTPAAASPIADRAPTATVTPTEKPVSPIAERKPTPADPVTTLADSMSTPDAAANRKVFKVIDKGEYVNRNVKVGEDRFVDTRWDKRSKNWVTVVQDKKGNQLGDAVSARGMEKAIAAHVSAIKFEQERRTNAQQEVRPDAKISEGKETPPPEAPVEPVSITKETPVKRTNSRREFEAAFSKEHTNKDLAKIMLGLIDPKYIQRMEAAKKIRQIDTLRDAVSKKTDTVERKIDKMVEAGQDYGSKNEKHRAAYEKLENTRDALMSFDEYLGKIEAIKSPIEGRKGKGTGEEVVEPGAGVAHGGLGSAISIFKEAVGWDSKPHKNDPARMILRRDTEAMDRRMHEDFRVALSNPKAKGKPTRAGGGGRLSDLDPREIKKAHSKIIKEYSQKDIRAQDIIAKRNAGATRQMMEKHPELKKLTPPNIKFMRDALAKDPAGRFWYENYTETKSDGIRGLTAKEERLLDASMATTSANTPVYENMLRGLGAFAEWITGRPGTTPVMGRVPFIRGMKEGMAGENVKTSPFYDTFQYTSGKSDKVPYPVVDIHMGKIYGLEKAGDISGVATEYIARHLIGMTRDINERILRPMGAEPMTPWQLQGLLWSHQNPRGATYGDSLAKILDILKDSGIKVPYDRKTERMYLDKSVFTHPGFVRTLHESAIRFEDAFTHTAEVKTVKTPLGRAATKTRAILQVEADAGNKKAARAIKEMNLFEAQAIKDMAKSQSITRGDGSTVTTSVLTELWSAITGGKKGDIGGKLGRVGVPENVATGARGTAGTYNLEPAMNMHVPLYEMTAPSKLELSKLDAKGRERAVKEAEGGRQLWAAVLGEGFSQDAAANHHFRILNPGERPKGVSTPSVLIKGHRISAQEVDRLVHVLGKDIIVRSYNNGDMILVPTFGGKPLALQKLADGIRRVTKEGELHEHRGDFLSVEGIDYLSSSQFKPIIQKGRERLTNAEIAKTKKSGAREDKEILSKISLKEARGYLLRGDRPSNWGALNPRERGRLAAWRGRSRVRQLDQAINQIRGIREAYDANIKNSISSGLNDVRLDRAKKKRASGDQSPMEIVYGGLPINNIPGLRRGRGLRDNHGFIYFGGLVDRMMKAGIKGGHLIDNAAKWLGHAVDVPLRSIVRAGELLVGRFGRGINSLIGAVYRRYQDWKKGKWKDRPKEEGDPKPLHREAGKPAPESLLEKFHSVIMKSRAYDRKHTKKIHESRVERAKRMRLMQARGIGGRLEIEAMEKALIGRHPRRGMEPLNKEMTAKELDSLIDHVSSHKLLADSPFTVYKLGRILVDMYEYGYVPTIFEARSLTNILGSRVSSAVRSKISAGERVRQFGLELVGSSRTIKASVDISGTGRQGFPFLMSHPILSSKAFINQIRAIGSEKYAMEFDKLHRAGREGKLQKDSGLDKPEFTTRGGVESMEGLHAREEIYASRLIQDFAKLQPKSVTGKVLTAMPKLLGIGVEASERAYVTYLNSVRSRVFNQINKQLEHEASKRNWSDSKLSGERIKLAKLINAATGRSNLPRKAIGDILNATFFSPRFMFSRLEYPFRVAQMAVSGGPVAVEALKQVVGIASAWTSLAIMVGVGAETFGWDASVGHDLRSSDFLKVKVGDKTRIDYGAGFAPFARTIARIATGESVDPVTGRVRITQNLHEFSKVMEYKLAPVPAALWALVEKETASGEKITPLTMGKALAMPISIEGLIEATREHGIEGSLFAVPDMLGFGVNVYQSERKGGSSSSRSGFGGGGFGGGGFGGGGFGGSSF